MTSTLIERRISHVTITRALVVFFSVLLLVPAFLPDTYESVRHTHEPILHTLAQLYKSGSVNYREAVELYVQEQRTGEDPLIRLEGPDYLYEAPEYENDGLRKLEMKRFSAAGFSVVLNHQSALQFHSTLALAETCYVTLLLVVSIYAINTSVERLIVHPLESTWEKVQILKRKPMSVMSGDFDKHAGVLSVMQSNKDRIAQ